MSIKIKFLTKEESIRAIAIQPAVVFHQMAIERIYELTHGQPFLLESLSSELIYKHKRDASNMEISPAVRVENVSTVVDSPEFYWRRGGYFVGIWNSLYSSEMAVLKCLADEAQGLTLSEITKKIGSKNATATSLCVGVLNMHNVIEKVDGRYRVAIELFRRWILRTF